MHRTILEANNLLMSCSKGWVCMRSRNKLAVCASAFCFSCDDAFLKCSWQYYLLPAETAERVLFLFFCSTSVTEHIKMHGCACDLESHGVHQQ